MVGLEVGFVVEAVVKIGNGLTVGLGGGLKGGKRGRCASHVLNTSRTRANTDIFSGRTLSISDIWRLNTGS